MTTIINEYRYRNGKNYYYKYTDQNNKDIPESEAQSLLKEFNFVLIEKYDNSLKYELNSKQKLIDTTAPVYQVQSHMQLAEYPTKKRCYVEANMMYGPKTIFFDYYEEALNFIDDYNDNMGGCPGPRMSTDDIIFY